MQACDDPSIEARAEAPGAASDLLHLAGRQRPLHRPIKLLQRRKHDAPAQHRAMRLQTPCLDVPCVLRLGMAEHLIKLAPHRMFRLSPMPTASLAASTLKPLRGVLNSAAC